MTKSKAKLHVASKFNVDQLIEQPLFATNPEAALPLLSMLGQAQLSIEDLLGQLSRQFIEQLLALSAQSVAGAQHKGRHTGDVRWHGSQGGVVNLGHSKLHVKRWFPASFHAAAPAAIERMRDMIRRTSLAGYVGCCEAIRDMDQRESVRAIRNPVLVIIGAKDPATTPEAGRAIHAAIPGAAMAVLDAAHISNVEQPDAYMRTVQAFLLEQTG